MELAATNNLNDEFLKIQAAIKVLERQIKKTDSSNPRRKDLEDTKKSIELEAEYILLQLGKADSESKYRLPIKAT
jgi:hypothetical protein